MPEETTTYYPVSVLPSHSLPLASAGRREAQSAAFAPTVQWQRVCFCGLANGTLGAIPAWMTDRERCVGCELSPTPEVSVEALEEIRTILVELSLLVTSTTMRTRRTPVRGEVRKDAEEKGGDPTRIGTDTTRVLA
jgi:hypothetical protein